MLPRDALIRALITVHYAYPALIFAYFITATAISVFTLQSRRALPKGKSVRTRLISALLLAYICTYLAQAAAISAFFLIGRAWIGYQDYVISLLSCVLVFGLQSALFLDSERIVWFPYYGSWILALLFEPAIAILSLLSGRFSTVPYYVVSIDLAIACLRYAILIVTASTYFITEGIIRRRRVESSDDERQALLAKPANGHVGASGDGTASYGTSTNEEQGQSIPGESAREAQERKARERMERRLEEEGNWFAYVKRFSVFWPYIWPVGNRLLQLRLVLSALCLFLSSALNLLIPRQIAIILDTLGSSNQSNVWVEILIYAGLKFASQIGVYRLRWWLWMPIEYYTLETLSVAAYTHILNLSADFHHSTNTSDMGVAIRTGQDLSNVVEFLCFRTLPSFLDLVVAVCYLTVIFGPYEGFISIATGVVFIYIASSTTAKLSAANRRYVDSLFEEQRIQQASLRGWETVVSFNQAGYECNRYANAIRDEVAKSKVVYWVGMDTYLLDSSVLLCGLIAGVFLAAYQIKSGNATPGQLGMLLMYWSQLSQPLYYFSSLGRQLTRQFVKVERLLDIMLKVPSVKSKKNARPLNTKGCDVEFNDVCFSYDEKKPIVNNLNLKVPGGTTVGFVGATGAGKTTILKLLSRLYDVTSGSIHIDGQDIRDIDLGSLRDCIGLVPQTPIIFDDTLMNNIRYAKITASDEEVFEACRAACIHNDILEMTDGYKTRVGEMGAKLSGGQLQRIAIARAILKDPKIILLDEATSSVDSDTEQKIQKSLKKLGEGRTCFIVAHRLSTICDADTIIVIENGKILEQGSHEQLLSINGKYADFWSKQVPPKLKSEGCKPGGAEDAALIDLGEEDNTNEVTGNISAPGLSTASSSGKGGKAENEHGNGAAKTPKGHKKEGSKLNPVAPEFTPQSYMVAHPPTANATGLSIKYGGHLAAASATQDGVNPRPSTPPPTGIQDAAILKRETEFKKAVEEAAKRAAAEKNGQTGGHARRDHERSTMVDEEAADGVSQLQLTMFRRPRLSRRFHSKSQPSESLTLDSETAESDISHSDDVFEDHSSASRRVSAPNLEGHCFSQPNTTESLSRVPSGQSDHESIDIRGVDNQNAAPSRSCSHDRRARRGKFKPRK